MIGFVEIITDRNTVVLNVAHKQNGYSFNVTMTKAGNDHDLIRVVLADDHSGVRSGIRHLLEREPDISVIGETTDGIEALELAELLVPDILLLDVEMPGMTGIEVAKQLKAQDSNVRILALSSYDQREYIQAMLQNGASGYLVKDEAPDLLVEAVLGVSRGETGWFSSRVKSRIQNDS
jgi:DNA-binding NarL/FixJ family response regulator